MNNWDARGVATWQEDSNLDLNAFQPFEGLSAGSVRRLSLSRTRSSSHFEEVRRTVPDTWRHPPVLWVSCQQNRFLVTSRARV